MKKLLSTTLAVGILSSMSFAPAFALDVNALPELNSARNAEVTQQGNQMNVQIQGGNGSVGTLNWDSFNVGSEAGVNFEFTDHNQVALNKVSSAGGLSEIYGQITNSSCGAGCGYESTGKVILINPNGVIFGSGANVNLNSFTVSTLDGDYDAAKGQLVLQKGANQGETGIAVLEGAKIYGDKNVAFAANNIRIYKGSQISTNTGINSVDGYALGKVKLITSDGVTFTYINNNGAVKDVKNTQSASNSMILSVQGDINSGNIDIRNHSANGDIALKDATLKATKAEKGNDGNIWLIAEGSVISQGGKYNADGNLKAEAGAALNKNDAGEFEGGVSFYQDKINVGGDVKITAHNANAVISSTDINTPADVNIKAGNVVSVQKNSKVNAKNVTLEAGETAQIHTASVNADDVSLTGKNIWLHNAKVNAKNTVTAKATAGDVTAEGADLKAGKKVTLDAAKNIKGDINLNDSQGNLFAGDSIDVQLANVGNRQNGLVAEAENDVTIKTNGTLSVSRLVSKNGDMDLTANNIIAGLPYTSEEKIPNGDESERSYIYVRNGEFRSTTYNDSYEVTDSDTFIDGDTKQVRHHIQYGDGKEKILLINPRPYKAPETGDNNNGTTIGGVDSDQASMLNKIPRQPETYSNVANISNGRTSLVDVFAAASQIEIEEDEEE